MHNVDVGQIGYEISAQLDINISDISRSQNPIRYGTIVSNIVREGVLMDV